MGMLSDKMNEDFDRRIEISKKLGVEVHGKEMMQFQIESIKGNPDAMKNLLAGKKKQINR